VEVGKVVGQKMTCLILCFVVSLFPPLPDIVMGQCFGSDSNDVWASEERECHHATYSRTFFLSSFFSLSFLFSLSLSLSFSFSLVLSLSLVLSFSLYLSLSFNSFLFLFLTSPQPQRQPITDEERRRRAREAAEQRAAAV
jgi:hypothetical protein